MKNLILVTLMLMTTCETLAIGFDCSSNVPYARGGRLIVSTVGASDTLTIEFNGQLIYHSVPVVSDFVNQSNIYRSLNFKNKNNAPAALYAQIYRKDGKLLFEFNEGSYIPVVPVLGGECWQF